MSDPESPEAEPQLKAPEELQPTDLEAHTGVDLDETAPPQDREAEQAAADATVLAENRKHTRRDFMIGAAAAAAGVGFYRWIETSDYLGMQPKPFRRIIQANAKLSRALFDDRAMAPTYPMERAEHLRINGLIGLKASLVQDSWRLQLVGVENAKSYRQYVKDVTAWDYKFSGINNSEDPRHPGKIAEYADTEDDITKVQVAPTERIRRDHPGRKPRGHEEAGESESTLQAGTPGLLLTMDDLQTFPRHELVTQFKCIEGWSQIVHWKGFRFADFIAAYPPAQKPDGTLPRYVYMETPNGDYYVGYDLHVCLHPQTLLVTEMGGEPLTPLHGAPLRLHCPAKYGYKQIKQIGLIAYTDEKPDDYWSKLGYDWYAGI
jgi:hypothetical protein